MSSRPEIAVLVVSHDSAADLPGCLEAVARLRWPRLRAVVVDCASSDGSARVAREAAPCSLELSVFDLEHNLGFAGGMNEGLKRSSSPLVLSLNPDARPDPDFLLRLVEAREAAASWRVGAITGRLVRPASDGQEAPLDACGMYLSPAWRHFDRGSGEMDKGQYEELERVFGATGAASLFVREALDDVALDGEVFDLDFHTYREDAELCFRLRERGWEILYAPRARAVHRRLNLPSRRRAMSSAVNRSSLRNRYLLRLYHQTGWNLIWTLLPATFRDLAALTWVLAAERSSFGTYGWLWRNRRRILERRRRIQARRTRPPRELDRWFRSRSLPI